ncbi:hypothetical protein Ocin01_12823 [Orchesella cincta]|uniref:Uncharacterized protein n=1 Tax=Orchesella cincta TaxID=48709 RepID=A0A1D2MLD8_ORCCI|nr:hypothetical protein Ocin01_12823 [Orchesella cincta]
MKLSKELTKLRTLSRTDRCLPLVFVLVSTLFVAECSGYWFFSPPGRSQQQDNVPAASRRTETNGGFFDRMGLAPAETLWIGSNKINWSPLPLFLQFTKPNEYKQKQLQQQQQQQKEAQARKFQLTNPFQLNSPFPVKDPFSSQKHLFPYPQSIGLGLSPVNPSSSSPIPFPPQTQPFAESRSSIQPPLAENYSPVSRYSAPTTPLPLVSSPSLTDSIFPRDSLSTPASVALSSPGVSINPIIEQLKKMTQWSKTKQTKQNTFSKKEGRYRGHGHIPHSENQNRFNLKNKIKKNKKNKKDRSNIQDIILADDDQDSELPTLKRVQKHKRKSVDSREAFAPSDLVVVHPTNAVYLLDPMEVQQTALKKYQINRKDKKLGMFRSEDAIERPAPFSFKFGPQDAKPSPYRN